MKQKGSRREEVLDGELRAAFSLASPRSCHSRASLAAFIRPRAAAQVSPPPPGWHPPVRSSGLLVVFWHSISFLRKVICLDFCDSLLSHVPVVKRQTENLWPFFLFRPCFTVCPSLPFWESLLPPSSLCFSSFLWWPIHYLSLSFITLKHLVNQSTFCHFCPRTVMCSCLDKDDWSLLHIFLLFTLISLSPSLVSWQWSSEE